jgi:hypothetical protein
LYNDLNLTYLYGDWGLGIGDWGLGIGDWAQSPKIELNFHNFKTYDKIKF